MADAAGVIAAASAVFLALAKRKAMPARIEMAAIRKYFGLILKYFILGSILAVASPASCCPADPYVKSWRTIAFSASTCKRYSQQTPSVM
jgi:hypothetical protein